MMHGIQFTLQGEFLLNQNKARLAHRPAGTNTYLVGRGKQRILIDTAQGEPAWASRLKTLLTEENATVHKALITHWHHDHVNGIPDLLKICPQATIYKHHPEDGQTDIQDGEVFSVEGATLKAFHTPGHTEDHMAFVFEEEDSMFTGDSRRFPPPLFVSF